MRGIREIQKEIDDKTCFMAIAQDPRVKSLIDHIRDENKSAVEDLKKELELAKTAKAPKKARWPEGTPEDIVELCSSFWGPSYWNKFRIHMWNDDFVWTSIPSGGYHLYGFRPTQAMFELISRTVKDHNSGNTKAQSVLMLDGKVTEKQMSAHMITKSNQLNPVEYKF